MVPADGGELPALPGDPKGGRAGGLARGAQKVFKAIFRKFR